MARVTVTRDFDLANLELVTEADMREVGLLAREQIVRRTLRGLAADGSPFAPYSRGYAKAKARALGTSAVNLQVSGAMLNDLTIVDVKVTPEKAVVSLGWTK